MLVFKWSWLPWILIIAGIEMLSEGESAGIAFLIIGVIWAFSRLGAKNNSEDTKNTQDNSKKTVSMQKSTQGQTSNSNIVNSPVSEQKQFYQNKSRAFVNTKRICPVCRREVGAEEKFCSQCGTKVENESKTKIYKMVCPHCGREPEEEEMIFCSQCGVKYERRPFIVNK